mgnify:CR=1 FL=1
MAIDVRIPTILRTYTGGEKAVSGEGSTLAALIDDLESRHSGLRNARRAITRSSKLAVSDAPDSSRRAASSSSAMRGLPRLWSATSTRTEPVGRSPSIPSTRSASSSRPRGSSSIRLAGRRAVSIDAIARLSGWARVSSPGW